LRLALGARLVFLLRPGFALLALLRFALGAALAFLLRAAVALLAVLRLALGAALIALLLVLRRGKTEVLDDPAAEADHDHGEGEDEDRPQGADARQESLDHCFYNAQSAGAVRSCDARD
jgi:hypothetical protein